MCNTFQHNKNINRLLISDGCVCYIDSSRIVLSTTNNPTSIHITSANIAGTWRWFDGETIWIYRNGGTTRLSYGNRGIWKAKWNGSRYIYTTTWNHGQYIDKLTLQGNG